jgi:zinc protease
MRMRLIVAGLVLYSGVAALAEGPAGEEFALENGLTVLLRPVEGATDTAVVVLFDVGGDHDPPGRSGLAHLVEHVYVTAAAGETPARNVAEFVRAYPKGWNAQTGDRYTVVATIVPNERLDGELAEEAARMGDLRVTEADLEREKPRIVEEVGNMFGGMPQLAAVNIARELVRPTPNGGRKGGRPEQVQAIRVDDVREHWRRYYKPRNATLVLAGGFDAAAAREAVTKRFEALSMGEEAPVPAEAGEPTLGKMKTVSVRSVVPNAASTACLAFAALLPSDERYAAYLVLVARLSESSGGLFGLFGDGTQVVAPLIDDPAVVGITSPVKQGETGEAAVARLEAFVAKAVVARRTSEDAKRVRQVLGPLVGIGDPSALGGNVYGVAFAAGRRRQLGLDSKRLDAALAEVSDADVRRVAKEVFGADRHGAAVVSVEAK